MSNHSHVKEKTYCVMNLLVVALSPPPPPPHLRAPPSLSLSLSLSLSPHRLTHIYLCVCWVVCVCVCGTRGRARLIKRGPACLLTRAQLSARACMCLRCRHAHMTWTSTRPGPKCRSWYQRVSVRLTRQFVCLFLFCFCFFFNELSSQSVFSTHLLFHKMSLL